MHLRFFHGEDVLGTVRCVERSGGLVLEIRHHKETSHTSPAHLEGNGHTSRITPGQANSVYSLLPAHLRRCLQRSHGGCEATEAFEDLVEFRLYCRSDIILDLFRVRMRCQRSIDDALELVLDRGLPNPVIGCVGEQDELRQDISHFLFDGGAVNPGLSQARASRYCVCAKLVSLLLVCLLARLDGRQAVGV